MPIRIFFLLAAFLFASPSFAEVIPGVGRFDSYRAALAGKRVGLVVNQASVFRGKHTIDFLLAKGVRVVRLFALEHGVRGEGGAGEEIKDGIDPVSGLPVISLYGPNKKPSSQALAGLDIVVYDIQDVGVRFYTYISSLGLIMEACAENGVRVLVLDRPNPNDYVEGPVLDPALKSFVGAFPIPVVYGLTPAELARMIVGERWQRVRGLKLEVAKLSGYQRGGEPEPLEKRPSPGLRSMQAIRAYPSIALFEPSIVSFGRGTSQPFAQYGYPGAPLGGHRFVPEDGLHKGEECSGEEFFSLLVSRVPRFTTDYFTRALKLVKKRPFLLNERFLRLLVGDHRVVDGMLEGRSYAELRRGFAPALERYKIKRAQYLLY